ncbi:hypothetical protein DMN91_009207, partial [Ooceraea biroi]
MVGKNKSIVEKKEEMCHSLGIMSVGIIDMASYVEYRCSACKKEIKNTAVQCKKCIKLFYHPGCVNKHRVYNKHQELLKCEGPFEEINIESDKEDMRRAVTGGNSEERKGFVEFTGVAGVGASVSGSSKKPLSIDIKIDWLMETVKEMKDEVAGKKELRVMIREIISSELEIVKQELKQEIYELRKKIQGGITEVTENTHRSYSDVVLERKKESVIIVQSKKQQESEVTRKLVKERIDVKNMAVGITQLRKGNKGSVILGCDNEGEMMKLKASVQDKLGEDYNIMEPKGVKPKIKIVNVGEEEMALEEESLMNVIRKQNKIDGNREGCHMRMIKKIVKEKRDDVKYRKGGEIGSLILEVDEETHESLIAHKQKIQQQVMKKMNPAVLVLSETRLIADIEDNEVNIPGYSVVRCDAENRYTGGVMMHRADLGGVAAQRAGLGGSAAQRAGLGRPELESSGRGMVPTVSRAALIYPQTLGPGGRDAWWNRSGSTALWYAVPAASRAGALRGASGVASSCVTSQLLLPTDFPRRLEFCDLLTDK